MKDMQAIGDIVLDDKNKAVLASDIEPGQNSRLIAGAGSILDDEFIKEFKLKKDVHFEEREGVFATVVGEVIDGNTIRVNNQLFKANVEDSEGKLSNEDKEFFKSLDPKVIKVKELNDRENKLNELETELITKENQLTEKVTNYETAKEELNQKIKEFNDTVKEKSAEDEKKETKEAEEA